MSADIPKDIAVGVANATPGATAVVAAKSHAIDPAGILTWLTITLVALQIAYYAWKWGSDYKARKRADAREAREDALRLDAAGKAAANDEREVA